MCVNKAMVSTEDNMALSSDSLLRLHQAVCVKAWGCLRLTIAGRVISYTHLCLVSPPLIYTDFCGQIN